MSGLLVFFFKDPAPTEIYTRKDTLSLHDALPIWLLSLDQRGAEQVQPTGIDNLTVRSEEHTSELQSPFLSSYAVFCLRKKKINKMMDVRLKVKKVKIRILFLR